MMGVCLLSRYLYISGMEKARQAVAEYVSPPNHPITAKVRRTSEKKLLLYQNEVSRFVVFVWGFRHRESKNGSFCEP